MIPSFLKRSSSQGRQNEARAGNGPRVPRHSSGWVALLKHLKEDQGLRVLDIGPTSPTNINFLTGLGHGIYMADLVREAVANEWMRPSPEPGGEPEFDVQRFLSQNMDFGGRQFDVVLLWTSLDYLPEPLIAPVIERFRECMLKGGKILALFHTKMTGQDTAYCRYHLTDSDQIEVQESEPYPMRQVYTNRSIEKLFAGFGGYKFFLARDNVYEVLITR